jgi:hypothetical protein
LGTETVATFSGTGNNTATLPSATGLDGKEVTVVNLQTGGSIAVTSVVQSGGGNTFTLSTQYNTVTVRAAGGTWFVIAHN